MHGDRIIEINPFKLHYDGMFEVTFEYEQKEYRLRIYLEPSMLLEIYEKEGFSKKMDIGWKGVNCTQTTLLFEVFDEEDGLSFLLDQRAEHQQDINIYLFYCKLKKEENENPKNAE